MIRIRLINEGRVVKQITSRVHEGVVLEQVKQFKDAFDTVQIVEGELSEDAKSMLQHVARKIIPAAMAAGVAMSGAGPAQAQGGANPNYPGLNHSIGQHMADIFSPNYKEAMRQREHNRNTERQVWDAEQNEIRKQRIADARARAGGGNNTVQKHMIYDQSRLSQDGKSYIIYGIDNTVRRIPVASTEYMPGDGQRLPHYITSGGSVLYVRHPHAVTSVAEGNMPQSVIRSKQKYADMSDQEFHAAHKDKSEDTLRSMARRHGYGQDSNVYVNKHKKGQTGVAEAAQGHTIEAHGVRGMDRRTWRKTFRNTDQMTAWAEKNDAEIIGTRDLEQARHGNLSPAKAKGVAEGNEWQGNRGNSQAGITDHTFDEAKQYIKGNYPLHKTYNVSRVEPGMRYRANPEKVANKTQSLVKGIDSALDYLQVKQNPMMSGSTQVTPSIGYSWHTHENRANGIAVLYYEDRGMGNDTITIAAKDQNNFKGAVQVCRDAGVIPTPKVNKQGVAEGFDKLTPQQKAHEYNLDSAQREMDRRDAEGEDMTGATIDKKTYKIVKPKQQGVAEGHTVTRGIDRERYQERAGLEGPFSTKSGKVVYYDPKEGKYYDPDTDFYIGHEDYAKMDEDATVGTIPASGASAVTNKTQFSKTGGTTDVKFNSKGQLELDDEIDPEAIATLKKAGVEVAEAAGVSPELSAILDQYSDAYDEFKAGGDLTDNSSFYEALVNFFSDSKEMSYDVATSGDPAEWIANKLDQMSGAQPMGESDDEASAADQAGADKNIIMQIRRAADYEIPVAMKLGDGSSIKIDSQTASKMLNQFNKLKPESKALMQQTLNTEEGFREVLNYFNEREVQEDMQFIEQISNHMKPITEAKLRANNLIKSVFGR